MTPPSAYLGPLALDGERRDQVGQFHIEASSKYAVTSAGNEDGGILDRVCRLGLDLNDVTNYPGPLRCVKVLDGIDRFGHIVAGHNCDPPRLSCVT